MNGLLQQLQSVFEEQKLFSPGGTLLLCVSGGCDSVALLHLLCQLRGLYHWNLSVLHFHHGLRPESNEEAEFVHELVSGYGLPFFRKDADHLTPSQSGLQEDARNWRRSEALKLLKEIEGDWIGTAHHADDQLETWLLKWLRGAHLSGLQAMSWSDPPFFRPLLNFSKTQLQSYLRENGWSWQEDPSNLDPKYLRNRIRHELIPLLRELSREGLETRIGDIDEQSRLLEKDIQKRFEDWDLDQQKNSVLDLERWRLEPELLRQEILHRFITQQTGLPTTYRKLKRILALLDSHDSKWQFHFEGGWNLECQGQYLNCSKKKPLSPK